MTAPAGSQQSQSLGLVSKIFIFFFILNPLFVITPVEIFLSKLETLINTVAYTLFFILFLVSRMAVNHLLDPLHHFGMGLLWIHRLG